MLFNPIDPNGFTMYVMQSAEYTENVLAAAERFLRQGVPADMAVKQAMHWENVFEYDLTESDIEKIDNWIEENS
jgi:hypothetical protein